MNQDTKDLILIVDDHPNNLKVLFSVLRDSGFKVLVAKDGESALEKLQDILPDLILLDVLMPGIDGFETCERLKSLPRTKDIPVIFMTALSEAVDKIKGLSLGAVDYITKPFQQEEVLARVKLHLGLRNLHKALEEQNSILKQEIEARTRVEAELETLTQELERRVQERTFELSQALKNLQQTQVQLLQSEEKLQHDAFHDPLTNLPNRAWFMKRLECLIQIASQRRDYLYAVLLIDLDRFKVVNDSLGHVVGDELLRSIARQLQASLRDTDAVARFGGDEFVILLEKIQDINQAIAIAERIQKQLRVPFYLNDYEVFTEVSIGIILSTTGYSRPEDVLRDADIAMYHAKARGKGRYEVFDPAMQTLAMTRLQVENDLRRALIKPLEESGTAQNEFFLYYQPIVSLSTGELSGFEALLRWYHPSKGWILPDQFIPVAEETGLIQSIGWWVLQEACHQLSVWQRQFPHYSHLVLSVNLSAVQLKQAGLLEQLEKILQETGISRAGLKLEITESCILETVSWEAKMLKQLKSLGIKLCIDDFGTGYSSLSRLHEFPIDTLKIDRSFVSCIELERSNLEIVQTIMTLARIRDMDVVAEGIETPSQLKKLRDLGCELGQGYLFSRPIDSEKVSQLLMDNQRFDVNSV